MAFKDWFDYLREDELLREQQEKESMMTDISKVSKFIVGIIRETDENYNIDYTLETATLQAQRKTDRDQDGDSYGVYQLVGYAVPAAPQATFTTLS